MKNTKSNPKRKSTKPSKKGKGVAAPKTASKSSKKDTRWNLRLYVAGQTPRSLTAFANLKRFCEEHLAGRSVIEVVDLLKQPELAEGDQIRGAADAWFANCPSRSSALSATYPIPNG